jgi:hypothetical protein
MPRDYSGTGIKIGWKHGRGMAQGSLDLIEAMRVIAEAAQPIKAGATIAAENGATAFQLMAIFDWATISQAEVYTKAANQKRMAGEAMGLLVERAENEPLSHPSVAPSQTTGNKR